MPRIHRPLAASLAAALSLSALSARAADVNIDGSQRFQTVAGVGVNINVNSWDGGALAPALQSLTDVEGASVWRVIRDPMVWVSDESDIAPLHALDPATLTRVYEQPSMQDLWATLGWLNAHGQSGQQVMLNFMGWTPTWLGGSGQYGVASSITAGKEPEWATMVASLVYYGRHVKGLSFNLLGPLNEEDWNCLEGPCLDPNQYTTALHDLVQELDAMGLSDIELVAPDTAGGPDAYSAAIMADPVVAARVAHLGMHSYGGATSPATAHPPADYWLTETAASCSDCDYAGTPSQGEWAFASGTGDAVLGDLENGFGAVLVYDGFDSFYYHHDSLGFWGLLALDPNTNTYVPRQRLYVNAQLARFVRPGMVRVSESDAVSSLGVVVAFVDDATGALAIVGHNQGAANTVSFQLANLPSVSQLELYVTDATTNLADQGPVGVTQGAFSLDLGADQFFSLVTPGGTSGTSGSTTGTSGTSGASTTGSSSGSTSTSGSSGTGTSTGGSSSGSASASSSTTGSSAGKVSSGCGCGSDAGSSSLLAVLAALLMATRLGRRRG